VVTSESMEQPGEPSGLLNGQALDLLNAIEARIPVASWRVNGIQVWPIVRTRLYFSLVLGSRRPLSASSRLSRVFGPLTRAWATSTSAVLAREVDAAANDRADRPADIVFLANSADRTRVGEQWFDKVCGPVAAEAGAAGLRTLLLERTPSHRYMVPRHEPSVLIQPLLDRIALQATAVAGVTVPRSIELEGFADAHAMLRDAGCGEAMPSRAELRRWIERIEQSAAYFGRVLSETQARLAFVSNYFDIAGMAFVLACRRAGLRVVELQHAVQSALHAAYGRWHQVPEGGYELLPSVFWSWTQEDVEAIRQWSDAVPDHHSAILGGNGWAAAWAADSRLASFRDGYANRIALLKQQYAGTLDVLATFQEPLYGEAEIRALLAAVRESAGRWRWWLRSHPTAEPGLLENWVAAHGIAHAIVAPASDIPLQALLSQVDVHVTHSSSSVAEAADLGVPSVVISEYGRELHSGHVASGAAVVAISTGDIVSAVEGQSLRRLAMGERRAPAIAEHLQRLLPRASRLATS
jgi:hypothetical protein